VIGIAHRHLTGQMILPVYCLFVKGLEFGLLLDELVPLLATGGPRQAELTASPAAAFANSCFTGWRIGRRWIRWWGRWTDQEHAQR
jgi:hypothetical protein